MAFTRLLAGPSAGLVAVLTLIPLAAAAYFISQAGAVLDGDALQGTWSWVPSLDVAFAVRLDGLSWLFACLITVVGTAVVMYAGAYLKGDQQLGRFYAYLFLFMGSMLGLVLADDIILLFVFWELTSISSYLLVGFRHENPNARKAALQALLVTSGGGLAMLAGLILMADVVGSTSITVIAASGDVLRESGSYPAMLGLICLGAFTKSAQAPFHFWLPGAMAAPTPVSAYLHSATMVKAGVYLLARLHPGLGDTLAWTITLTTAGGVTAVMGSYMALQGHDLKRILAYSTVAMLGLLVFLLGLGTEAAIVGMVVLLVAHAGYKAVLFLSAGIMEHHAGTRDIGELRGIAGSRTVLSVLVAVGLIGLAGLPPVASFIGKEEALIASRDEAFAPLLMLALVVVKALSVAVAVVLATRLFRRPRGDRGAGDAGTPPAGEWLPPLALAAVTLVGGTWLALTGDRVVEPAVAPVLGYGVEARLVYWHGFSLELGLTAVGVLSGVGLGAMWLRRDGLLPIPARLAGRAGPAVAYDRGLAGLLEVARVQTGILQHGRLRLYAAVTVLVWMSLVLVALVRDASLPARADWSDVGFYEGVAVALLVIGGIGTVVSRSQLGAVAFVGAVGYGVALVYTLFGAPDLAMTQFLVETLTVVLFVLVFYRLPRFSRLSSPATRLRDATIAGATGVVACVLVLHVQGVALAEPVSGYFLEEAVPSALGHNVVNTILVDFRALDTLGEITVLAIAALGVYALLRIRRRGRDSA